MVLSGFLNSTLLILLPKDGLNGSLSVHCSRTQQLFRVEGRLKAAAAIAVEEAARGVGVVVVVLVVAVVVVVVVLVAAVVVVVIAMVIIVIVVTGYCCCFGTCFGHSLELAVALCNSGLGTCTPCILSESIICASLPVQNFR